MKIVKIILGWLLVLGGVVAAVFFAYALIVVLGFQSLYSYTKWRWQLQDLLIFATVALSLAVSVAGCALSMHTFGVNAKKDTMASSAIIVALIAWAIAAYFALIYRW
jgi:hypothetical protein